MGKESMWWGCMTVAEWGSGSSVGPCVHSVHVSLMSGNGMEDGEGGGSRTESMAATERRAQWQKGECCGGKESVTMAGGRGQ